MGLTDQNSRSEAFAVFARAGLPRELVTAWLDSDDAPSADFRADCEKFSRRWGMGGELLERLPLKPDRSDAQATAAVAPANPRDFKRP